MEIKWKIFVYMFLTGFILTILGVFSHSIFFRLTVEDQVKENIAILAESRTDNLVLYLDELDTALKFVYNSDFYRDVLYSGNYEDSLEGINEDFESILSIHNEIYRASLLSAEGVVIASSDKSFIDYDKHYITDELQSQNSYFIDAHISEITGDPAMGFAYAIRDVQDNLLGAIIVHISLDKVYSITSDLTGLGETGEILLVNSEKDIISPSRFIDNVNFKLKSENENTDNCFIGGGDTYAHLNHEPISYDNYVGKPVVGFHSYIPQTDWCLVVEVEKVEAFALLKTDLLVGLLLIILITASVGLIANIVGRKISDPIKKLKEGTDKVREGDLDYKVAMDSNDEIGQLSRAFDDMTEAIKDSIEQVDSKVQEQTEFLDAQKKELEQQQKAVLNVLDDVNSEKEKTQKLASDLKKFELAVEGASDHIVITDADGIILYANHGVEQITGFKRKQLIGQKAGIKDNWGGLQDKEFYENLWDTIKNKKEIFEGEVKNKRKNGQEYFAAASISPILNDEGEVVFFVGIERDITRAKEVDRMKTEFISLASHQLRTPLSGMKWFLHMLLDGDAGELNSEQKKFIEKVLNSNERMIDLVKALLNISRIESGRIIVEPEPTRLDKLANQVLDEEKPAISEHNHKVELEIEENLPEINVDPKLTREIYNTLITNAIKYTPNGGKITIRIFSEEDKVTSEISDNGYGIPKDEQHKIFQKFYRGSNIIKVSTDGNGLGMYLVKAIVDSSNGEISFESKENEGTTFRFSLPKEGIKRKEGEVRINQ